MGSIDKSLAGKVVAVTGGASGIGLAIAKFFASQDSTINILDINETSGADLASTLAAEFPKASVSFKKCDISSWDNQKSVFGQIYKENGRIDVVIPNAGITEKGSFIPKNDGEPLKPNLTTLDVNLIGTLYTINLAIHYMRKNSDSHKGSIVCTASNAGLYPLPIAPMYAASKFGVVGTVRSLARPLLPEGIQINALAPAVIATNISSDGVLFKSMILTPVSTAIAAIQEFMHNPHLTGNIAEVSGEKVTFRPPHDHVDEDTAKNMEMFWTLRMA